MGIVTELNANDRHLKGYNLPRGNKRKGGERLEMFAEMAKEKNFRDSSRDRKTFREDKQEFLAWVKDRFRV